MARAQQKAAPPLAHPYVVLAIAGLGVFVAALDQTVVVTALPEVFLEIGLPVTRLDQGAWIITGYLIGYTAAMPLMGKVADVYGHGRVYILSMAVFMLGSALVALGDDLPWLVSARVLQAIGGGAVVPVSIAIAHDALPESRRGVAIGLVVGIAEAGAVLGPLYGGLVLRFLDWRWLFWLNLPQAAPVALLMALLVPNARRPEVRVDYLGGLLLGASLTFLALGLSGEAVLPAGTGWRVLTLGLAAAFLAGFGAWQRRAEDPLLPLEAFRRLQFAAAHGAHFLVGGALILALVNVPLMTDTVMGQPPLEGGLRLLRLTMMIPVGAVLGGLLYNRLGYRAPMILGLGLSALGFFLLTRWPLDIAEPRLTLELMVCGLGFGLVIPPITLAALNNVMESQKATASAVIVVARMVGMIAGLSALSAWGQDRFATLVDRIPAPVFAPGASQRVVDERTAEYQDAVAQAGLAFFHEVFLIGMAVMLVAVVPALLMGGHRQGTTNKGQGSWGNPGSGP